MSIANDCVCRDGATWRQLRDSVSGEVVAEVNLDIDFGNETAHLFECAPAMLAALEDILEDPDSAVERAQAAVSLLRAKI